jgi:predicted DNA-binding protein
MKSLTLKLPEGLHAKLAAIAKRRNATKSALVREALESYLANGAKGTFVSLYDLTADLCGSLKGGPRDLSYNKKYMEGFGE